MTRPKVTIDTSLGVMIFELYPEAAPATAANFLKLVRKGFYGETADYVCYFYRVIPGFVAQGGPLGDHDEQVNSAPIKGEFGPILHERGVLSMCRSEDPDSASCQFFICLGKLAKLNGQYASFGRLIAGEDVLRQIEQAETTDGLDGAKSRPVEPILILRVEEMVRDSK